MNTPIQEVEVLPNLEMSECPQDFQVSIRTGFGAFMQQADALVAKGREIAAADESPKQESEARETRLALVKIRTGAEKLHKEMKAGILTQGRAIDGAKNIVIACTEPTEKEMKAIEDRAARLEEEARLNLHNQRKAELNQYTTAYDTLSLGRLTEDEYDAMLSGAKLAHEARIEAERKAAEALAEAEKSAQAERDRLESERIEKERLAEEEREKVAAENARLKAEADRIAAEREAERKAAADELAAERAERERIERETKAESNRLAKIESDRLAAEKAEQERIEKEAAKAAAAPDKEKIVAFVNKLKSLAITEMATVKGKKAALQIAAIIEESITKIRTIYTEL